MRAARGRARPTSAERFCARSAAAKKTPRSDETVTSTSVRAAVAGMTVSSLGIERRLE